MPEDFDGKTLRETAHRLIPGGAHTYAKGDDQFPAAAPAVLIRGRGAHVWDERGNEYIEYGMGLRSVTLGHAHPEVVEAAYGAMKRGTNLGRPSPIEIEYAEELLDVISTGEMVKFAKNGSDVTTAAVKLARAVTRRDLVAVCADQPFFSVDDWFIGTTEMDAGIPLAIKNLTLRFPYGDLEATRRLFEANPEAISCLILEAAKYSEPPLGYLPALKKLCEEHGALLILDEMITGFRWHLRGAQHVYGVEPDLSCFGKGMSNGFALGALVGKREIMERGGLFHDEERVFLLSTTHGAETHALAAAQATLRIYQRENVVETLYRQGDRLRQGVLEVVDAHGLQGFLTLAGRPCNLVFGTNDSSGTPSQAFRALFMQELSRRGVLAPSFVVSFTHGDEEIDKTIEAVNGAAGVYALALENGVEKFLEGPPTDIVFRRYNQRKTNRVAQR